MPVGANVPHAVGRLEGNGIGWPQARVGVGWAAWVGGKVVDSCRVVRILFAKRSTVARPSMPFSFLFISPSPVYVGWLSSASARRDEMRASSLFHLSFRRLLPSFSACCMKKHLHGENAAHIMVFLEYMVECTSSFTASLGTSRYADGIMGHTRP